MQYKKQGNNFFDLYEYEFFIPKYMKVFYYDSSGNKKERVIVDGYKSEFLKPDVNFYLSGNYKNYRNYNRISFSVNYKVYNFFYCTRSFSSPQNAIWFLLEEYFPDYEFSLGRDSDFYNCFKDDLIKGFEKEVVFCYGYNADNKPHYWIVGKPNIRRLLTFNLSEYKENSRIEHSNDTLWFFDKNQDILKRWFGENITKVREERRLSIMIRRLAKCETVLSNRKKFQQKQK